MLKDVGEECGWSWDGSADAIETKCKAGLECKMEYDEYLMDAQFGKCVRKKPGQFWSYKISHVYNNAYNLIILHAGNQLI